MDILVALVVLASLVFFLGLGVWVAFSLMAVAGISVYFFTNIPVGQILATSGWSAANSYSLTALPLFIWMGEILTRSRMSEDLFTGLAPWMRRIPGRLIHINILGSGIFAAVAGSSAATCATVGRMSIPELRRRGYDDKLIFGTLAASSTLGLLIPPSMIMIVYGVATEQSVARLFIAGILPGLMLIALFMGYIVVRALLNPGLVPAAEPRMPLREKLRQSRRLLPVFALIVCVVGAIYGGLASPTDAAAVGVGFSLLIVYLSGDWEWKVIKAGLISASYTTCMIGLIVITANFLTAAMGFVGLPRNLANWIAAMELSPYALIAALTVFFVIIGTALDGISIVILTASIIMPMVVAAGIDPIWFGIYLVIAVEVSLLTPPVGFNLFVIQGITGENIFRIAWSAMPFFFLMMLAIVILCIWPEIATWLPDAMLSR